MNTIHGLLNKPHKKLDRLMAVAENVGKLTSSYLYTYTHTYVLNKFSLKKYYVILNNE